MTNAVLVLGPYWAKIRMPCESAEKENFERKFKDPNGTPSASDNPVSFAGLRYQQTAVSRRHAAGERSMVQTT